MVEHVDITDPELHEPKGIAAATVDQVYVANGAGSGAWEKITSDSLNQSSIETYIQSILDDDTLVLPTFFTATVVIPDISTLSDVYIAVPEDCTVIEACSVLAGPITVADAIITFFNGANSLGAGMTVGFSGSAAGDVDTFTATTNTEVTGPSYLRIHTDGGSTDAQPLYITVVFELAT